MVVSYLFLLPKKAYFVNDLGVLYNFYHSTVLFYVHSYRHVHLLRQLKYYYWVCLNYFWVTEKLLLTTSFILFLCALGMQFGNILISPSF
jgi:hypothetical protein